MDSSIRKESSDFIKNSQYHALFEGLQQDLPLLRSLTMYMRAIEQERGAGQLGSHDSDSILAAEVSTAGVTYTRISCYDPNDIEPHRDMLSGKGDTQKIRARVLVVEDVSPAQ